MNIAIDIGNTRLKAGVFDGKQLVDSIALHISEEDALATFINESKVENAIVSSVHTDSKMWLLDNVMGTVIELGVETMIPITNSYLTPKTLGKDRIAAAVGGHALFPEADVLVIDAGTCITYDVVTASGEFVGGNIAPGLDMRLISMHEQTKGLPKVDRELASHQLLGRSTDVAIANGATHGIVFEIEEYIRLLAAQYVGLQTVLTGGDSSFFGDKLKTKIFVRSNLVLLGLNEILKVNVAKHN